MREKDSIQDLGNFWCWSCLTGGSNFVQLLHVQNFLNNSDHIFSLRKRIIFESLGVGHRDISAGHTDGWGIEIVKSWALNAITQIMKPNADWRNLIELPSTIRETISAPTPDCGQPCSTDTKWFVFFTDSMTVSKSNGRRLRRLTTSASMPMALNSFAASKHVATAREKATKVMCLPIFRKKVKIRQRNLFLSRIFHVLPTRSILALPMGTMKSFDKTSSETSKGVPYIISFSRQTTGSGSRIAAFSKPLASSAE